MTVTAFAISGLAAVDALAKLSAQAGLPVGIEWLGPGPGPRMTGAWHNEKASLIAADIVGRAAPKWHYAAEVRHGVLEVRPAPGHSIGDYVVSKFALRHDSEPSAAVKLQDAARCLLLNDCPSTVIWMATGGEPIPNRDFHDVPVEEILDYLVTAGTTIRVWVLIEDPNSRIDDTPFWTTLQIFRRVPEKDQPWWTVLPWRAGIVVNASRSGVWPCPRCWEPPPPRRAR